MSLLIVFCVIAGLVFISNLDKMSTPGYGKRQDMLVNIGIKQIPGQLHISMTIAHQ
jgi:hypothetical protein